MSTQTLWYGLEKGPGIFQSFFQSVPDDCVDTAKQICCRTTGWLSFSDLGGGGYRRVSGGKGGEKEKKEEKEKKRKDGRYGYSRGFMGPEIGKRKVSIGDKRRSLASAPPRPS